LFEGIIIISVILVMVSAIALFLLAGIIDCYVEHKSLVRFSRILIYLVDIIACILFVIITFLLIVFR
jgi:hypothetical protein